MAGNVMNAVMAAMDRPMQWGQTDCCAAACTVFFDLFGIDPMRGVRGTYNSATEAREIVDPWGGLLPYAEHLAQRSALVPGDGLPGEIGVSLQGHAIGLGGRCLLICIKPGVWAAKNRRGFGTLTKVEKSWQTR